MKILCRENYLTLIKQKNIRDYESIQILKATIAFAKLQMQSESLIKKAFSRQGGKKQLKIYYEVKIKEKVRLA